MEGLGDVELGHLPRRPVHTLVLGQEPSIEQHAHRLYGVERHALGAGEDAVAKIRRKSGDESVEQLRHRLLGKGGKREGRLMRALPEFGMAALQLRAGEAEHKDRPVARPLEQVSDELDQRGVGPLEILEEEGDGALLGHPLEEDAPSAEQLLLCPSRAFLEPEQVKDPRLDEATLFVVDNEGVERRANLLAGRGGVFAFDDAGSHAHHLGERPEGDALAVRQAAAAMPPDAVLEPVHVLEELPAEPGLADACDPRHRHEVCALLVRGRVEELLHEPQLAVTPDERRLEARPTSGHRLFPR